MHGLTGGSWKRNHDRPRPRRRTILRETAGSPAAPCPTADHGHRASEIIDGKTNHLIPGMDSRTPEGSDRIATYLDGMHSTPGAPLLNGTGEAWYESTRGTYTFRSSSTTNPAGSSFLAPPSYFTNKTGVALGP
jgi:hypothetical protein